MDVFMVLQMLFDAVLLFGILFLFHFSVNHVQRKKEESEILNDLQARDIKENLQELLMTLKQLGKEVSDNIQEQVKEAEGKTENFKKVISKLQRDLAKVTKLADEVEAEKDHLENKARAIEAAKKKLPKPLPKIQRTFLEASPERALEGLEGKKQVKNPSMGFGFDGSEKSMGFSSGVVREVYRLADGRVEMNQIVQQTKLSRAEVQLILNLRGNRFTTPH
jgi:chromosome segregation ATPase